MCTPGWFERVIGALRSRFAYRRRAGLHKVLKITTKHVTNTINPAIVVNINERKPVGAVDSTCSLAEAKVLWYLRLSRLFGCLFISNLSGKTLSNAVATWKTPYVIYAALWLWIAFVHRGIHMLSITSLGFSDYVTLAFRVFLLLKVLVNYASFCLGSAKLLDFLQSATAFEKTTSFTPTARKKS
ncbi:hypothetical protein HPB52_000160 [Rhipicephalus sanguineus]|uniref:Uncharacterized protein n=1 Tax=Rhipicephalus sanguineus TaxID=34632 RepID=A0A9D4PD19_RHISA|nr:hypothetical protein HPB52_000160 [Rhipicephalus sanguineus]